MPEFHRNDTTIHYTVEYKKKKKNVTIYIKPDLGIKVTAPKRVSLQQIQSIVEEKADWILKKLSQLKEQTKENPAKRFVEGEQFFYLGKCYPLTLHDRNGKRATFTFQNDQFVATLLSEMDDSQRKDVIKTLFINWYKKAGLAFIEDRVRYYSEIMKLTPTKVTVKEQKKRWGTCTNRGHLHFNWRLMMAPIDVIDYVVVHELAHLKHFNHSPDFWRLVEQTMPDYREKKEWLKKNGILYHF